MTQEDRDYFSERDNEMYVKRFRNFDLLDT